MRVSLRAILLIGFALPLAAQAAPKAKVLALLEQARYVAFGYDLGSGFVSADDISAVAARTLPEERRALEAIRSDVEKWARYAVTDRSSRADILIVIRIGRRGSLDVGAGRGGVGDTWGERRGGQPPSTGSVGVQLSSDEDRLDVYQAAGGQPGMRLWSGAASDGLAGSPPRLYKSFREEVEESAKKP